MEDQKNHKQCEICKDEEAVTLCLDCYCYFCEVCYKCVHDRKKNSNHKKEKIDFFFPIDTKCPSHLGNSMNLFCIDDKGNIYIIILISF